MLIYGQPAFFITLNPADLFDSNLLKFTGDYTPEELARLFDGLNPSGIASVATRAQRAATVAQKPAATAKWFNAVMKAWLLAMCGWDLSTSQPKPSEYSLLNCPGLGDVVAYFGAVECQLRGSVKRLVLFVLS